MSDAVRTRTVLSQLRTAGVGLSIDDFGTGYSSFTHLRDLPVSEIKIDKSFVTAAPTSAANAAIVKSTIELAHNLGLDVVAEGVESERCLDILTDMGCDLVQGYLLARPMPAGDLVPWLDASIPARGGRAATAAFTAAGTGLRSGGLLTHEPGRIIVPC
jgi:EAL domain-containing protein (putative c-di-GMP-specific phosphodiesterase class I)